MTLEQWEKTYGHVVQYPGGNPHVGAIVAVNAGSYGYHQLWQLSDYRVASVSGGSVWLWLKKGPLSS